MGLTSAELREIKSAVTSVFNEKFLQEIASKVAVLLKAEFQEQIEAQKNEITALKKLTYQLQEDSHVLRKQIDDQEQSMRSMNVRIHGLKIPDGQNINKCVIEMFKNRLEVNVKKEEMEKCYLVSSKINPDKTPSVLIRFCSESSRMSVLKKRKLLKDSGISITEDLTKQRLSLLTNAANKFSKKNSWVLNGNIYVKRDDRVYRINNESDLKNL